MPPLGADLEGARKELPPMRPLERAASANSGETASVANTEPATASASAALNPAGIFFSSLSSAADATATSLVAFAGVATARGLRNRGRERVSLEISISLTRARGGRREAEGSVDAERSRSRRT